MPQISQIYASARVRALGSSLLTKQAIERLVTANSPAEVARLLSDAGWGDVQDRAGAEKRCDASVREACRILRELSPDTDVTDCFLIKYDVLNLKALIKSRLTGGEAVLSDNGLTDPAVLRHAVAESNYASLPGALRAVMERIEQGLAVEVDPLWIDSELDKTMFAMIEANMSRAKRADPRIRSYFAAKADQANLLIALRCHALGRGNDVGSLFVPGGVLDVTALETVAEDPDFARKAVENSPYRETVVRGMEEYSSGGAVSMEKRMDDYALSLLTSGKYEVESLLPLVGYYLAREREAAAVRLILTAKAVGASNDALMTHLRELYA